MVAISYFGLCFCIIISAVLFVSAKEDHVPLLIWGPNYSLLKVDGLPGLKKVSSEDFLNHLLKNVYKENKKNPPILLFVEETFSTEDFSTIVAKNDNAFPALNEIAKNYKFEYLPSVEDPVKVLKSSEIKNYGYTWSEHTSDIDSIKLNSGTIYKINLEDADSKEDRPDMLQRHDGKVANIYYNVVKNNNDVIAILTGGYPSWTEPEEVIRVRRQANETGRNDSAAPKPAEAKSGVVLETKSVLMYTKKPPVLKINDREVTLQSSSGVSDDREKWQRAIFSFGTDLGSVKLRFRFENTSNYWSLSQVELEQSSGLVLLTTNREIGAPYEHSFYTSKPVEFINGTISLSFSDLQVQPWKSAVEQMKKFGLAEDSDTAFFTTPIWTGILVTSIIGLILMWALSMIMDIRTMDQFDDPKGKTITVNVTD